MQMPQNRSCLQLMKHLSLNLKIAFLIIERKFINKIRNNKLGKDSKIRKIQDSIIEDKLSRPNYPHILTQFQPTKWFNCKIRSQPVLSPWLFQEKKVLLMHSSSLKQWNYTHISNITTSKSRSFLKQKPLKIISNHCLSKNRESSNEYWNDAKNIV